MTSVGFSGEQPGALQVGFRLPSSMVPQQPPHPGETHTLFPTKGDVM